MRFFVCLCQKLFDKVVTYASISNYCQCAWCQNLIVRYFQYLTYSFYNMKLLNIYIYIIDGKKSAFNDFIFTCNDF